MDTYKAQSTEITIDDEVLTITRKKIGKDEVRRIPLAAITDLRTDPGGRFAPALLQLILNDEPPPPHTPPTTPQARQQPNACSTAPGNDQPARQRPPQGPARSPRQQNRRESPKSAPT